MKDIKKSKNNNFTMVPNELYQLYTRIPGFNGNHVLMYIVLKSYHNDKYGYAFPDQSELSRRLNCHETTVGRIANKLKEVGLIDHRRESVGGNYRYYVKEPIKDVSTFISTFPNADTTGIDVELGADSDDNDDELLNWF